MNITRHLYLSTALRSPDEPAAPDPATVDPVIVADPVVAAATEADPAAVDPAAVDQHDPAAAASADPASAPHGNAGKSPWYMRELAKRTEKTNEERTAREAAERKNADLQAIIDRMQADPATPKAAAAAPAQPADFNSAVDAAAEKKLFYADTEVVKAAGLSLFPDFGESLTILNAIGVTNDDFVEDVLAVDKVGAHKILDKLAKDPEKAASLVGMDSRRRIAELTRMADAPKIEVKPPKPAAISKAPTPKPQLSPLAAAPEVDPTSAEGNEKMSDAEWERWYKNKYMKRA
jgi:hypothetical protein